MVNLHSQNHKKGTEETNKWKDIPCVQIRGIKIAKMSILPKGFHKLSAIPIKICMAFFTQKIKILKFFVEPQTLQIDKAILRKY